MYCIDLILIQNRQFAPSIPIYKVTSILPHQTEESDIAEKMTTDIVKKVGDMNKNYKAAFEEIKEELGEPNFNVETILSNLEQKATLIGKGSLNNLRKEDFGNIIIEIKKNICEMVSVHKARKG